MAERAEKYGADKWTHDPAQWDAAISQAGDKLKEIRNKLPKEPAKLE